MGCRSAIILNQILHVHLGLCCHAHLVQRPSILLCLFYPCMYSGQACLFYSKNYVNQGFWFMWLQSKHLGLHEMCEDIRTCEFVLNLVRVLLGLTGFASEHTGHRCICTGYGAPVIAMDIELICLSEMSGLRDFGWCIIQHKKSNTPSLYPPTDLPLNSVPFDRRQDMIWQTSHCFQVIVTGNGEWHLSSSMSV